MKFAIVFETATALTTWAANVFETIDAAIDELADLRNISAQAGSNLGQHYSVRGVLPLGETGLQTDKGEPVLLK
jgi:hypothetical protein